MVHRFWDQHADMFVTDVQGSDERHTAHTGSVAALYRLWLELPEAVRATAHMRLADRSLLTADEIAALQTRPDFLLGSGLGA